MLQKNLLIALLLVLFVASCGPVRMIALPDNSVDSNGQKIVENDGTPNSTPHSLESIKVKSPHQSTRRNKKSKRSVKLTKRLENYCNKIEETFHKFNWSDSGCDTHRWNHVRNSVDGEPLIWLTYGNEKEHRKKHKDTTLVMCGVHGDEITPIKFCFDIIDYLTANYKEKYSDKMIIIAPIVNPDSFFKGRPTRTNSRGVDVNRNFPTKDWWARATKLWKSRYGSDKRRYPGKKPASEPEVIFQMNLMARYKPDKIISVHAPLTMLDYDGPEKNAKNKLTGQGILANELLIQMSKKADGYRIKNYPYFPGSLGNYAGIERDIPTYTLELPTSDYTKHKKYWKLFKHAIQYAFLHDMRPHSNDKAHAPVALDDTPHEHR